MFQIQSLANINEYIYNKIINKQINEFNEMATRKGRKTIGLIIEFKQPVASFFAFGFFIT